MKDFNNTIVNMTKEELEMALNEETSKNIKFLIETVSQVTDTIASLTKVIEATNHFSSTLDERVLNVEKEVVKLKAMGKLLINGIKEEKDEKEGGVSEK